jgi:hypothetical protein
MEEREGRKKEATLSSTLTINVLSSLLSGLSPSKHPKEFLYHCLSSYFSFYMECHTPGNIPKPSDLSWTLCAWCLHHLSTVTTLMIEIHLANISLHGYFHSLAQKTLKARITF